MNELQIFNNAEFGRVRILTIDEEPWFVGKDIAEALGYKDASSAVAKRVDSDDKTTLPIRQGGSNYQTNISFINESGLYSLILSSKLESAKRFKHWVTSEVLPSIRKTGSYSMPSTRPLTTDDYMNASRIIATAKRETLPYVLDFLTKAGIEVAKIRGIEVQRTGRTVRIVHESVEAYLQEHEVVDRPVGDVYKEYVTFCCNQGMDFVNNITFSKQVNAMLGTQSIVRKMGNQSKRVFI